MKAAFVTMYDITRSFGGSVSYLASALEAQGVELQRIMAPPELTVRRKATGWLCNTLLKREYSLHRDSAAIREVSRRVAAELDKDVEVIISPQSVGSHPVTYLETRLPIVIWTDSCLAHAVQSYPELQRLWGRSLRDGLSNERTALSRCDRLVYTSSWAAKAAAEIYGLDSSGISVLPYGPAIDTPSHPDAIETMLQHRPKDRCTLIAVVSSWWRKGMDIACEAADLLNRRGLETELVIVGARPPASTPPPPCVRSVGRIDKKTPDGRRRLRGLLASSHLMILPTRVDCLPVALSEAGGFGLPCVVSNVGGISTLIRDGDNGVLPPSRSSGGDYADAVAEIMSDRGKYEDLCRRSYRRHHSEFSWPVLARSFAAIVQEAITGGASTRRPIPPLRLQ